MNVYHGTNKTSANLIAGPSGAVDVTRGGGELGRGFYAGENISLAVSFAKGRYNSDGVVIEFDIDNSAYVKLNVKILNRRRYVYQVWRSLFRRGLLNRFLFHCDVVVAPFAIIDFSYQYKFESIAAQDTLNNDSSTKIL